MQYDCELKGNGVDRIIHFSSVKKAESVKKLMKEGSEFEEEFKYVRILPSELRGRFNFWS